MSQQVGADAVAIAALAESLETVGTRLTAAYARRGSDIRDAVGDAVQSVLVECLECGESSLTPRDAVRRMSAAVKRETRAMRAALGLTESRGTRSDMGRLTPQAVAKLGPSARGALAEKHSNGSYADNADHADAVLAAVTLASLTPRLITGMRKRTGGAGASEATILQSHSAESDYLRGVRDASLVAACDSVGNTYGASGRVADAMSALRTACDYAESVTGESLSAADIFAAFYCAPVYVKRRGESAPVLAKPRRVDLAACARQVSAVTGDAPSGHAVALRRAAVVWADAVRSDARERETAALAPTPRTRRPVAFYGWGRAQANRLAIG